MSANISWRRSPTILSALAALGVLACAHAQIVGFGICRYHSTTGFTDENIDMMTSQADGYSLVLTTLRSSLRACQRLTLYSNGTLRFAHIDDYNDVSKYKGSFTAKMSTYTETGYIDLSLSPTVLDADNLGNLRLYVLAVEDSYLVLASCINVGLVRIEQVHMFVPTSQLVNTNIKELKAKLTELNTRQVENVREVNQACAAGLRDGTTSGIRDVSLFFQTLVRHGVIRPVQRQEVGTTEWNQFKLTHSKEYVSNEENKMRLKIYTENKNMIAQHNQLFNFGERTFKMKMNKFGDLTQPEFLNRMTGLLESPLNISTESTFIPPLSAEPIPSSIDWRTLGAVTPVKDQWECGGSSYAFSATGSLEGQHFRKTSYLTSLSEQNILDCSRSYGNNGCNGGYVTNAFSYIKDNNGIALEVNYPYEGVEQRCNFNANTIVGARVTGHIDLAKGNAAALKAAVATIGPVSVGFDVVESFQFYSSGVYSSSDCSKTHVNHAVLAVGYGTLTSGIKSTSYWIVKNSYGMDWGDNGYFLLNRDIDNMCGVLMLSSYPLV